MPAALDRKGEPMGDERLVWLGLRPGSNRSQISGERADPVGRLGRPTDRPESRQYLHPRWEWAADRPSGSGPQGPTKPPTSYWPPQAS
jgi:hypothetical protein